MKALMIAGAIAALATLAVKLDRDHERALDACRAANTGANCDWIVR